MFAHLNLTRLRPHFLTLCVTGGILVVSPNLVLAQCSGGGGGGGGGGMGRMGGGGGGASSGSGSTGTTGVNVSSQTIGNLSRMNSQNAAAGTSQAMAAFSDLYAGDLWIQQIAWEEMMAERQQMMRQAQLAARRAALARQRRMNSSNIAQTQKSGWNRPSANQSTATNKSAVNKTTASKVKVAPLPAKYSASLSKTKSNPQNQSSTDTLAQK
ncbi:MAG: hypothetical protein U0903_12790 [Planctomycetales bacterium]